MTSVVKTAIKLSHRVCYYHIKETMMAVLEPSNDGHQWYQMYPLTYNGVCQVMVFDVSTRRTEQHAALFFPSNVMKLLMEAPNGASDGSVNTAVRS